MKQTGLATRKPDFPQSYQAARAALARCETVDECREWANKAKALAAYAAQARDLTLEKMAMRIRARAVRRAGELLEEVKKAANQHDAAARARGGGSPSRQAAAKAAGLSDDQRKTALRVARVPSEAFEKAVESGWPPSILELAKAGTKPRPMPKHEVEDPVLFAKATKGQVGIETLYKATQEIGAADCVAGSSRQEQAQMLKQTTACMVWLKQVIVAIRKGKK